MTFLFSSSWASSCDLVEMYFWMSETLNVPIKAHLEQSEQGYRHVDEYSPFPKALYFVISSCKACSLPLSAVAAALLDIVCVFARGGKGQSLKFERRENGCVHFGAETVDSSAHSHYHWVWGKSILVLLHSKMISYMTPRTHVWVYSDNSLQRRTSNYVSSLPSPISDSTATWMWTTSMSAGLWKG